MEIQATQTFIRLYRKLPDPVKKKTRQVLRLLQENPQHNSLGHKKMAAQESIYEIRVSRNYRITYQLDGDIAILRKIGTHDLLRRP